MAFHAGASSVQWVAQSYALFSAALLLFSAALGDQFGRKKIFVLGVVFFTVSSLGCAAADSLSLLILWRSLQGIGASLFIPQSLAILSAASSTEDRAAAIGTWSAWTSVFGALGPLAAGWLIQSLNWRWAFAIFLPFSAVGMTLFATFAHQPGYGASLLPGMIGLGAGITIALAPLTNVVMTSVPNGKSSLASAVNNSVSRLAGLLALSGLILVLSKAFDHSLAQQLSSSSLPSNAKDSLYAGRSLMAADGIPNTLNGKEKEAAVAIIADSYTHGYKVVMYCCAVAALLSALPVIFWWRGAVEKAPVRDTRTDNLGQQRQELA